MEKNRNEIPVADIEIEPFTLLRDIVSNALFILLGALAAAMLSYVLVSVRYVPQYTTSTTFVVGSKGSNNTYANLNSANTMATTLQKVLESTVMKKTICEEMKVDEIDADITAEVLEGTNLLVLSVTTDNPKDSIDIIRIIMEHYSDVAIYTVGNAVMSVLEEPDIPYAPDNYLDTRDAVKKGFLAGALFCICLFGLLSYMKNSVKQEKEIEKKLDARSLGAISYEYKYKTVRDFIKHKKGSVLVDNPISSFPFVESYKKLASKVEYQMGKGDRKVLVVTSVSENEGKSTVAANLAITLAEQGKKVILLDGDIRRPSQFLIFQLGIDEKNEIGEFLKGTGNLQDIMMKTERKNLYFLGGRNCYSSSTELIQTEKLPKMLNACRKYADYVIIDTPPAGLLGDAQIFALASDAVLLVARQNYMLAEDINDILDEFRANGSKILGVVLNGVQSFSKILDTYVTKNDFVIHAGSIVHGKITDVKNPKRLKRNATFKFIPITYYDYVTEKKYNIKKSIVGKYTSHDITPASIAKTGAVAAGNKLIGAFIGPSVAVVEGAIKNEQDNIAKSAAISVYESSPLSYVEKGKDLEIKKGDVFKINFNLGDDEK